MTRPKSIQKQKKNVRYRDARGRFISKAKHDLLKKRAIKRAIPSKKKSTKTPATHTKPILTKKKTVSKKPIVKSTRKKKSDIKPPVVKKKRLKKRPAIVIVAKKKKKVKGIIKPAAPVTKKKKKVKKRKKKIYHPEEIEVYEPVTKKKTVKKKAKKKIATPKGFELPVRGQLGMYNVEGVRGNSVDQLAVLVADQIARGAKRFRFWYKIKSSPAYPSGIASTLIVSDRMVATKFKTVLGYLKRLGGKVVNYWFVIP
jgi:hypothetical protein